MSKKRDNNYDNDDFVQDKLDLETGGMDENNQRSDEQSDNLSDALDENLAKDDDVIYLNSKTGSPMKDSKKKKKKAKKSEKEVVTSTAVVTPGIMKYYENWTHTKLSSQDISYINKKHEQVNNQCFDDMCFLSSSFISEKVQARNFLKEAATGKDGKKCTVKEEWVDKRGIEMYKFNNKFLFSYWSKFWNSEKNKWFYWVCGTESNQLGVIEASNIQKFNGFCYKNDRERKSYITNLVKLNNFVVGFCDNHEVLVFSFSTTKLIAKTELPNQFAIDDVVNFGVAWHQKDQMVVTTKTGVVAILNFNNIEQIKATTFVQYHSKKIKALAVISETPEEFIFCTASTDGYLQKLSVDSKFRLTCHQKVNFGPVITYINVFKYIAVIGFDNGLISIAECERFTIILSVNAHYKKSEVKSKVNWAGLQLLKSDECYLDKDSSNLARDVQSENEIAELFALTLNDFSTFKKFVKRLRIVCLYENGFYGLIGGDNVGYVEKISGDDKKNFIDVNVCKKILMEEQNNTVNLMFLVNTWSFMKNGNFMTGQGKKIMDSSQIYSSIMKIQLKVNETDLQEVKENIEKEHLDEGEKDNKNENKEFEVLTDPIGEGEDNSDQRGDDRLAGDDKQVIID